MSETSFVPVQTVTAEGQVIWHDGSTNYFDWLTKFEQRKNAEHVERLDKMECREPAKADMEAGNLKPKKGKIPKVSTKLSSVIGW